MRTSVSWRHLAGPITAAWPEILSATLPAAADSLLHPCLSHGYRVLYHNIDDDLVAQP